MVSFVLRYGVWKWIVLNDLQCTFLSTISLNFSQTLHSYDLSTPISLEEAVFALGYVDHDFYVYRDAENNEISVVYKRNAGGYGLIQPQS